MENNKLFDDKTQIELEPNYYSVTPVYILANKQMTDGAKLVFGLISSLSNRYGCCIASNQYIADITGKKKDTISRYISELSKLNYIRIEIDQIKNNFRKIYILDLLDKHPIRLGQTSDTSRTNIRDTIYNITYIKDIYIYYTQKISSSSKLTEGAKQKIRLRLKVYTKDELKKAIDNFSKDSWWMDNNGKRGVEWFFHSDGRIEQLLNMVPRKEAGTIDLTGNKTYYGSKN